MNIIYDLRELEGTCYIEVLPGPYTGKCWNETSVFFMEEVFGYLEPAIERAFPQYDHYGFDSISMEVWDKIILHLEDMKLFLLNQPQVEQLEEHIGFIFLSTKDEFVADMPSACEKLAALLEEFIDWIKQTGQKCDRISILGI